MPKEIDFLTQVWIVQAVYEQTIFGVFSTEEKARQKAAELNGGADPEFGFYVYRFTVQ